MKYPKLTIGFARFSLFLIFFWFGVLKIFTSSAANELVERLLDRTLPFLTFEQFILFFGIFEMVIGILFLFPKTFKLAAALFAFHIITTFMPLILLSELTWQRLLTPTLEGQYIIKNIVLIALVALVNRCEEWPYLNSANRKIP